VDLGRAAAAHSSSKVGTMKRPTRKHYDLDGAPAYWQRGEFPKVVTRQGENIIYDLARFFEKATRISELEFEALKLEIARTRRPPRPRPPRRS
jgi:hypothetical protein